MAASPPATTVVLDTCVLLADPDSLYAFGDADIVIPLTVIEELDGHKSRLDDVGRAARAVVRDLERLRVDSRGDFREPVALPTGGTLRVAINGLVLEPIAAHGLNPDKADNRILAAALGDGRPVKIVSAERPAIKASSSACPPRTTTGAGPTSTPGLAPGVAGHPDLIDSLFDAGAGASSDDLTADDREVIGMATNEYVVLTAGSSSALARCSQGPHPRRAAAARLGTRPVQGADLRPRPADGPRVASWRSRASGRDGQDDPGPRRRPEQMFEPGETQRYDRIMIIRPLVAVGRQDIGVPPRRQEREARTVVRNGRGHDGRVLARTRPQQGASHARRMGGGGDAVDGGRDLPALAGPAHLHHRRRGPEPRAVDPEDHPDQAGRGDPRSPSSATCPRSTVPSCPNAPQPSASSRTGSPARTSSAHLVLTQGERSPVADLAAELL